MVRSACGQRAVTESDPFPDRSGGAGVEAGASGAAPWAHDTARLEERGIVGRNMTFAAASFCASVLLSLVSSIATSRIYGIKVIGEYALVSAPWIMVTMLSTIAEQVEFIRRLSRLDARHPQISALLTVVLAFSSSLTFMVAAVVMGVTYVVFRGPVHRPDLVLPAALVVGAYTFIDNTSWNLDSVLSAFRRGRELLISRVAYLGSFLVLSLGLAAATRSVWGLTLATIGSFVCGFAARVVLVRRVMRLRTTRSELREAFTVLPAIIRFGLRLVPGILADAAGSQIGVLVLGSVAGVADVGAFSRASGLSSKLSEAAYRVCEILFPTLVRYHDRGAEADFAEVLERTYRLTGVPVFLAVACAGGAATPLLRVFGPGFDRAATALTFLFIAYGISVQSAIISQAIIAVGRPTATTVTALAGTFVGMAVLYPLTVQWGASGVAISMTLGAAVECIGRTFIVRRSIIPHAIPTGIGRTTALLAVGTIAGLGVGRAVVHGVAGFGGGVLAIIAGAIGYLIVVVLLRLVRADEWELARRRLSRHRVDDLA
jgi:O-antigen/teichoic acid export membrane protein